MTLFCREILLNGAAVFLRIGIERVLGVNLNAGDDFIRFLAGHADGLEVALRIRAGDMSGIDPQLLPDIFSQCGERQVCLNNCCEQGIRLLDTGIAAETEVSEGIADGPLVVDFHALQDMRMVHDDQIRAGINRGLAEAFLEIIAALAVFGSRMEDKDNGIDAVRFELGDLLLAFGEERIELGRDQTIECNPDAVLLKDVAVRVSKVSNVCLFELFHGGLVTAVTVILHMVIGKIAGLNRGYFQNIQKLRGSAEAELLFLVFTGGGVGDDTFKIDDGQIIVLKEVQEILEEIAVAVLLDMRFKGGRAVSVGFFTAERHIPCKGDGDGFVARIRYHFRIRTSDDRGKIDRLKVCRKTVLFAAGFGNLNGCHRLAQRTGDHKETDQQESQKTLFHMGSSFQKT